MLSDVELECLFMGRVSQMLLCVRMNVCVCVGGVDVFGIHWYAVTLRQSNVLVTFNINVI